MSGRYSNEVRPDGQKEGGSMRIGIIGAGRVGCSLGKYFRLKGAHLVGYYDASAEASK